MDIAVATSDNPEKYILGILCDGRNYYETKTTRDREIVQPEMVEEYRKRVFYAAERINNIPNMHVLYPPKGTFYLFVNIKDTGLDSVTVSDIILREAHVLTIPGISFGNCGEGYIRLACTVNVNTLKEAFDRIGKVSIFN